MDIKEQDIIDIFSKRIKYIRKRNHMTQDEFSKLLGITTRALQYYEKGERFPEIFMFYHICKSMNVSADYMLGLTEQLYPESDKTNPLPKLAKKTDPLAEALRALGL